MRDTTGVIVQGRSNGLPIVSAHELHRAWPRADYRNRRPTPAFGVGTGILGALARHATLHARVFVRGLT